MTGAGGGGPCQIRGPCQEGVPCEQCETNVLRSFVVGPCAGYPLLPLPPPHPPHLHLTVLGSASGWPLFGNRLLSGNLAHTPPTRTRTFCDACAICCSVRCAPIFPAIGLPVTSYRVAPCPLLGPCWTSRGVDVCFMCSPHKTNASSRAASGPCGPLLDPARSGCLLVESSAGKWLAMLRGVLFA